MRGAFAGQTQQIRGVKTIDFAGHKETVFGRSGMNRIREHGSLYLWSRTRGLAKGEAVGMFIYAFLGSVRGLRRTGAVTVCDETKEGDRNISKMTHWP